MYSTTGIIQGCYSGQQDRVDELNDRIFSRYVPDNNLRPNYDPRPVSTKYAFFPVIDRKIPSEIPMKQYLGEANQVLGEANQVLGEANQVLGEANQSNGFLPSTNNAPTIRNIDTETVLRNQVVALQHGIGQNEYVPSSESDLFKTTIVSRHSEQPFPRLFTKPTFSTNQPAIATQSIGKSDFFNYTRNQLRNSIVQK